MQHKAEAIRNILNQTLHRLGLAGRLKEMRALALFKDVVGERVAERAEAVAINNGRLHVRVASPVWRQELNYAKQEIIDSLNNSLGENIVTDIYFSG